MMRPVMMGNRETAAEAATKLQSSISLQARSDSTECIEAIRQGPTQCWICLEGALPERGELIKPCPCSNKSERYCHTRCLARWQLQNAGSRRERFCDFCGHSLPDWKIALTPTSGATAPAIMNVNFGGVAFSFMVRPGPEGYKEFTEAIRQAFHLPLDAELNISFTCDEPMAADDQQAAGGVPLLTLTGPGTGAYDAAVYCASVSAARRAVTGGRVQRNEHGSAPLYSRQQVQQQGRAAALHDGVQQASGPQHVCPHAGGRGSASQEAGRSASAGSGGGAEVGSQVAGVARTGSTGAGQGRSLFGRARYAPPAVRTYTEQPSSTECERKGFGRVRKVLEDLFAAWPALSPA